MLPPGSDTVTVRGFPGLFVFIVMTLHVGSLFSGNWLCGSFYVLPMYSVAKLYGCATAGQNQYLVTHKGKKKEKSSVGMKRMTEANEPFLIPRQCLVLHMIRTQKIADWIMRKMGPCWTSDCYDSVLRGLFNTKVAPSERERERVVFQKSAVFQ